MWFDGLVGLIVNVAEILMVASSMQSGSVNGHKKDSPILESSARE